MQKPKYKELNEGYLRSLYDYLVYEAENATNLNNVYKANCFLEAAGYLAYTFYLKYKDEKVESLLKTISTHINKKEDYIVSNDNAKCVFIDSLSIFNAGLTIQYIRALNAADMEYLYISSNDINSSIRSRLAEELKNNNKTKIISVPSYIKGQKRLQFIYDTIINYNPSKVFLHIDPIATYFSEVCYALPKNIIKYLINYTDHSFLMGTDNADYSFEFRNYGCSISSLWRGINQDRLLLLPYYSILDTEEYLGLPEVCNGKKIILSGGNYWKIIDKEGTFFRISKSILDKNPDAIIVFAGRGNDDSVKLMLEKFKIQDRFILVGWRKDISELFNRSSLYLSTYPALGGLMSTYAAIKSVPIVAYSQDANHNVESCVCQLNKISISKSNIEEVCYEATKILNDPKYREEKARELHECVVTSTYFNKIFIESIYYKKNMGPIVDINNDVCISQKSIDSAISYLKESYKWSFVLVQKLGFYSYILELPIVWNYLTKKLSGIPSYIKRTF